MLALRFQVEVNNSCQKAFPLLEIHNTCGQGVVSRSMISIAWIEDSTDES